MKFFLIKKKKKKKAFDSVPIFNIRHKKSFTLVTLGIHEKKIGLNSFLSSILLLKLELVRYLHTLSNKFPNHRGVITNFILIYSLMIFFFFLKK